MKHLYAAFFIVLLAASQAAAKPGATPSSSQSEIADIAEEQSRRDLVRLNAQVAKLRGQIAELSNLLDFAEERDRTSRARIQALESRLNQALARAASEGRKRAALEAEEAERLRREKELLGEELVDLAAYRSALLDTMRRVLGDRNGMQVVGNRLSFSSDLLFESGATTLLPEGRALIAEVTWILENEADKIPANLDWILRVDGHTDDVSMTGVGAFAENWALSAGRALSVVNYMTEMLDFPPERLAAAGFGAFRPVALGNSEAARAQNRRIEMALILYSGSPKAPQTYLGSPNLGSWRKGLLSRDPANAVVRSPQPRTRPTRPPITSKEVVRQVVPPGPPLTHGEKEAFGLAVGQCWNVGSLTASARATTVVVAFDMQRNGKPVTESIRMVDFRGGSEADADRAFGAARRAIIRCGTKGFMLPVEKFDQWRKLEATFDSEGMQFR